MAEWKLIPTIIDKTKNIISIVAVREDAGITSIYYVPKATLSTIPSENLWILDEIWDKYLKATTENSGKVDYLVGLITLGKTNLEARE